VVSLFLSRSGVEYILSLQDEDLFPSAELFFILCDISSCRAINNLLFFIYSSNISCVS